MDIVSLLISLNKISLIIFLITCAVLGYEIYLLIKEKKQRDDPTIPNFDMNVQRKVQQVQFNKGEKKMVFSRSNNALIFVMVIFVLVFGFITTIGVFRYGTTKESAKIPVKETVITKTSKGIMLFSTEFKTLSEEDLRMLQAGDTIIIGVDKVQGSDIDMAKILVNSTDWADAVVTDKYDTKHNIYYITHTVASGEAQLYFKAQLHSKKDGWLGD